MMCIRLPFSFVNEEVTKATTLCLLEEASHAVAVSVVSCVYGCLHCLYPLYAHLQSGKNYVDAERDVLMEFGRCLSQIIRSSQSGMPSL